MSRYDFWYGQFLEFGVAACALAFLSTHSIDMLVVAAYLAYRAVMLEAKRK